MIIIAKEAAKKDDKKAGAKAAVPVPAPAAKGGKAPVPAPSPPAKGGKGAPAPEAAPVEKVKVKKEKKSQKERPHSKKKHTKVKVWKLYKVEGGKAVRKNDHCPRCGMGTFLASYKNRKYCGKCGWSHMIK